MYIIYIKLRANSQLFFLDVQHKIKSCNYEGNASVVMHSVWYLGPQLGLLYLSLCWCYIETTINNSYCEVFPIDLCNCRGLIITDSHPNDLQRLDYLTCDSLPASSTVHHMTSLARMHVKQANNFSGMCSGN